MDSPLNILKYLFACNPVGYGWNMQKLTKFVDSIGDMGSGMGQILKSTYSASV